MSKSQQNYFNNSNNDTSNLNHKENPKHSSTIVKSNGLSVKTNSRINTLVGSIDNEDIFSVSHTKHEILDATNNETQMNNDIQEESKYEDLTRQGSLLETDTITSILGKEKIIDIKMKSFGVRFAFHIPNISDYISNELRKKLRKALSKVFGTSFLQSKIRMSDNCLIGEIYFADEKSQQNLLERYRLGKNNKYVQFLKTEVCPEGGNILIGDCDGTINEFALTKVPYISAINIPKRLVDKFGKTNEEVLEWIKEDLIKSMDVYEDLSQFTGQITTDFKQTTDPYYNIRMLFFNPRAYELVLKKQNVQLELLKSTFPLIKVETHSSLGAVPNLPSSLEKALSEFNLDHIKQVFEAYCGKDKEPLNEKFFPKLVEGQWNIVAIFALDANMLRAVFQLTEEETKKALDFIRKLKKFRL